MKVNEKLSSVSSVFDLNLPADTTVCGMSSWLFQVTVSPTFTFSSVGSKVKLSIVHGGVFGAGRGRPSSEQGRGDGEADAEAAAS